MASYRRHRAAGDASSPLLLGIVALVVGLDQVSKSWAQSRLAGGSQIEVLGPIKLRLEYNSGFAFSLGSGHPAIIGFFAVVAVVMLVLFARRVKQLPMLVGIALIAGGALGNVVDRIFRHNGGAVIDFIYSGFWPTFNLADTAVVAGVALIFLNGLFGRSKHSLSEASRDGKEL